MFLAAYCPSSVSPLSEPVAFPVNPLSFPSTLSKFNKLDPFPLLKSNYLINGSIIIRKYFYICTLHNVFQRHYLKQRIMVIFSDWASWRPLNWLWSGPTVTLSLKPLSESTGRVAAGKARSSMKSRRRQPAGGQKLPCGHWGPKVMWLCPASHIPTTSGTYTRIISCSSFPWGTRGTLLT